MVTRCIFLYLDCGMASNSSDGSSASCTRKRKRGKSAGGKHAHYATRTTAEMRMPQYTGEPFEVMQTEKGAVLWCSACGKPVNHCTKNRVDQHLVQKCHKDGLERLRRSKQLQETHKEKASTQGRQPMPLTGRQTTLDNITEPVAIKR